MRREHWRIFLPNSRRLPLKTWFRSGDNFPLYRHALVQSGQTDMLETDSRRRYLSQRLPVSLGFTKLHSLERPDATLTCVDGRSRAVPRVSTGKPPSRTAQQHPVRAVCHAPSEGLARPFMAASVRCPRLQPLPAVPVGLWQATSFELAPKFGHYQYGPQFMPLSVIRRPSGFHRRA